MIEKSELVKYIDSVCEVLDNENNLIAIGKIQNVADDNISIISKMVMPILNFKDEFKVNIINNKAGFASIRSRVYTSNEEVLSLMDIVIIKDKNERKCYRVKTNLKDCRCFVLNNEEEYTVDIDDISLGGLKLISETEITEKNNISINVPLPKRDVDVSVTVRQDNVVENNHIYGCEFINITEKQKDYLNEYLFFLYRESRNAYKMD